MMQTSNTNYLSDTASAIFVAGRGSGPDDGLYHWLKEHGQWQGRHLSTVDELSALAAHPNRPVLYGVSGIAQDGRVHAWEIHGDRVQVLGDRDSQGAEPCHLAVHPSGRLLVVTNYTSSTLGVQALAEDGSFEGELELIRLHGSSIESPRQDDAHPHQAVFDGDRLYVVDLGADLLREYDVDLNRGGSEVLIPGRRTAIPAGTGPRHMVILPDGRVALSGELGSNIVTGHPVDNVSRWSSAVSTERTGPAKTRHLRNYPGDIQRSADGRLVYFANRGYDTISTFAVDSDAPRLVSEIDSGVAWPQHLMVTANSLMVAGWDSSRVMVMQLTDGIPGEPEVLFKCRGAGWLLADTVSASAG